jgi:DNA-binding SARP family transcriptional activator
VPAQAPLELAVLGPLHVLRDGRPLALGGPRQRAVLAVLLSAQSGPVAATRLVTEVWADDPASGSRSRDT